MTKTTVSISLTKELIERIDSERRLISRSAYVEFLLRKSLEVKKNDEL
jgi:metal-responsive CopG/Arc/MetJ family transcriptional regulator